MQLPGGWILPTILPEVLFRCPPGLECLSTVDQLQVHQIIELLEVLTGFETKNRYNVMNGLGQHVYYAVEHNDDCTRILGGSCRPFTMKILDNYRREVIRLYRDLNCDDCCFPCCLQTMVVSAPPGTTIGFIEQEWSLCLPIFAIKNAMRDVVLKIEGPLCTFSLCGSVEFNVFAADGIRQVGAIRKHWMGMVQEYYTDADNFGISFPVDLDVTIKAVLLGACFLIPLKPLEKKHWSGLARELFTDADNFGVSFPMDLDVKIKAVLLGACFLIDYMYFEKNSMQS